MNKGLIAPAHSLVDPKAIALDFKPFYPRHIPLPMAKDDLWH
ncbi:MAG: hypothetical protein VKL20_07045 [Synechocystis sp.]|nr:hypothetical protein [Synechocystis sp.]